MTRRAGLRILPALCALALACALPPDAGAAAADSVRKDSPPARTSSRRPRIGLVLSGGGARGAAHIGLLHVLEEHHIPVDCIAGTSMGALVGGLYAAGLSPQRLDSLVTSLDWADAFADRIRRGDRTFCRKRDDDLFLARARPGLRGRRVLIPSSALDSHRIDLLLKRLTLPVVSVRDFDRLGIPFRAVAADLVTGDAVVLDHGDLAQAMRASMSVPAVFSPTEIDGRLLVDGGIANNLPVDVTRRMGADVIIAVDIGIPPKKREDLNTLPAITFQLTVLAAERTRKRQMEALTDRDVFIQPDLGTMSMGSFDHAGDAIAIGRKAAEAVLARLEPFALVEDDYRAWQESRAARLPAGESLDITKVQIVNRTLVGDEVLQHRLDVKPGPLDVDRLEDGLDRMFGLELFQSVAYDVRPGARGDTLEVTPVPTAWGPNYLQAGFAIFDDYEHPSFNLAVWYLRTAVNRLNGEWGLGFQLGKEVGAWGRFHQPLDSRLHWFAEVEPAYVDWPISQFDEHGHQRAELGVIQYGGMLAVGREIGSWAEARAGILREGGTMRMLVGPPLPTQRIDTGELFVQLYADDLDGIAFPRRGFLARVRASSGMEELGSAVDYRQIFAEGALVETHKRLTGLIGAIAGATADNNAPIENQFRLGGLGRLSGLESDERIGQQELLLRAMAYHHMSVLFPVYTGLTVEYGNTFDEASEFGFESAILGGGVFLAAETPVGPLCLAYGRTEGGRDNYYLTLGQAIGGPRPSFRLR